MDLIARLSDLGGAARWGELTGTGARRRQLEACLASGEIVARGGGCYALPDVDVDILRARQFRARITCVSAARVGGLAVLEGPSSTHLAVPAQRSPRRISQPNRRGAVVHREAPMMLTAYPHPGVRSGAGPLVVAPAEALARMLRCQDPVASLVAIDSALNQRRCTVRDIETLLVGPGSRAARAVLAECDPRSQSPIETVARVTLRRAGLHVDAAVRIHGVGLVDLLVEGRVVVELDGFAYHSGRAEYRGDRRRDRELVAQGYLVLRFAWEDVMGDPSIVLRAVLAALART